MGSGVLIAEAPFIIFGGLGKGLLRCISSTLTLLDEFSFRAVI